jgi:hypothetical protein
VALALLLTPVRWLGEGWASSTLGKVGVVVALLVVASLSAKDGPPRRLALAALAVLFVPPLFAGFGDVLFLLLLSAVVWAVPAAAIGFFAPALRRPSEDTRTWGVAAFLAGAALFVLTVARLTDPWFLLPAALLLLTSAVLRRGSRLNDYWPLVALTCAMIVSGATWVRQELTFTGVFQRFHAANDADLLLSPKAVAPVLPAEWSKGISWDFGTGRLRRGLTDFSRLPTLSESLAGKGLSLASFLAPKAAWHEDAVLARLASEADDPRAAGQFDASRRGADASVLAVPTRLETKRGLLAQARARSSPTMTLLPGVKDRAYYRAAAERLAFEVAEAEEAQKVASDAQALAATPASVSIATLAPLWDRVTQGLAAWKSSEARAVGESLRAEVEAALSDLERTEAERLLGEERAPGADTSAQRLARARRLAAAVKAQPWRTPGGRAFAEGSLAALATAIADLEKAEGTRLAEAAKAVASAPSSDAGRGRRAEEVLAEVEGQVPLWSTDEGRKDLETVASRVKTRRDEWAAANRRDAARLLELCLCGSLGFWVSVGLLAGLRVLKDGPRTVVGPDGRTRCAWASTDVRRRFHDEEHGRRPADDRDLFRRLSLEILVDDRAWESLPGLPARFHDFDPAKVAATRLPGDVDPATVRERCDPRPLPEGGKRFLAPVEGMTLVIENAKRLLASSGGGRGGAILADWASRASDPAALVRHVEATFVLRRDAPTATFLQSVGLLPGAHARGCFRAEAGG